MNPIREPADLSSEAHSATIVYPGDIKTRPTIELRIQDDGTNEAFLVPSGGNPVPTGVTVEQEGNQYYLTCRIRRRRYRFTPEEVVRQFVLNRLVDDLGYPESRVAVEVPIQMGSSVHAKPADIVVYSNDHRDQHWITVEVKKPNRKDGIEQLKSYMNASGSVFGYWTNGADEKHLLRSDPNDFSKAVWRIPRDGETLDDVDEPLTRSRLSPVKDLYGVFKDIEQEILAHQSVDTFNEIFKVVFAKLYDERVNLFNMDAVAQFKLGVSEGGDAAVRRVRKLFEDAKQKWRDVYAPADEIELNDVNIRYCLTALQQYHLIRSGDILGVAFELLVNQEMKGEMGQYFTPRQVVRMMTDMMNPTLGQRVCDPACGSGGFLITTMRKVFDFIGDRWDDADDRAEQRKDYAQENLVGLDNDPRLVRVAKAYMIMENDGRSGVQAVDALDYGAWDKQLRERVAGRQLSGDHSAHELTKNRIPRDGVDVILTNPPFAGAIKAINTLRQYNLAIAGNGKPKSSVVRAVLFLERCIDMLKPGGRLAIVLPQGVFNNFNDQGIRDFVDQRARILAVVGLHPYTFKPFTLAKTSVLFLQKWGIDEELKTDYPIFTAVSTRPGKTKLGRPQYLDDGVTLDCDMPEISHAFRAFAREQNFDWA